MNRQRRRVFITGGTGYMGLKLIPRLLERGHEVRALVRPGSEKKLALGCVPVPGNALDGNTYASQIPPADTFVQLVGVGAPEPDKGGGIPKSGSGLRSGSGGGREGSGRPALCLPERRPPRTRHAGLYCGASRMRVGHRGGGTECDRPAALVRSGPGHWWPYLLLPMYKVAELLPPTREGARRLGLVTLEQMTTALLTAVENPAQGIKVVSVPEIRSATA